MIGLRVPDSHKHSHLISSQIKKSQGENDILVVKSAAVTIYFFGLMIDRPLFDLHFSSLMKLSIQNSKEGKQSIR